MNTPTRTFYGWYIAGACAGILFLLQGVIPNIGSAFYTIALKDMGLDRSDSGMWLIPVFLIPMLLMPLIIGRWVDASGSEKPMLAGCFICSGALFLLAGVSKLWQFQLIHFFVYTIGLAAAAGIAIDVLLLRWFRRRRGIAFGLVGAASGVGALLMKHAASPLVGTLGWGASCILFGILALFITVPLVRYYVKNTPSDMGLAPDGDEHGGPAQDNSIGHTLKEAYRTQSFWLIAVGLFLLNFARAPIQTNLLPYLSDLGYSQAHLRLGIDYSAGLGIIGALLLGWLADRWGARMVVIVGVFVTVASVILLIAASHTWILVLFFLVHGILTNSIFMLATIMIADCHGLREIGIILALIGLISWLGLTASPSLFMMIIDATTASAQGYRYAFALLIPLVLLSAYCIYKAKPLNPNPEA